MHDVVSIGRLVQLACLFSDLRRQKRMVVHEPIRVGALRRVVLAFDEPAFKFGEAVEVTKACGLRMVAEPAPSLFDGETKGVVVTVDVDGEQTLRCSGTQTLLPQFIPATRPVGDIARLKGLMQTVEIRIGETK